MNLKKLGWINNLEIIDLESNWNHDGEWDYERRDDRKIKVNFPNKSPMNGSILSLLVRGATVKKAKTE